MFTRWRLPPDSVVDRVVRALLEPGERRASGARRRPAAATFSSRANSRRFSSDRELACRSPPAAAPSRRPARGARRCPSPARCAPARISSSVVLPAPLGPMIASASPRRSLEADVAHARRACRSSCARPWRAGSPRARWRTPPRTGASAGTAGTISARLACVSHSPTSILFVGDLVGGLGRRTLLGLLPGLRERLAPTFVVVNGENVAGGVGHHAEARRRALRGGRRRRSRSATTPTTTARSCPTSTARSAILRPGELPARAARARHVRRRARRRAPRRREPVGQRLHARRAPARSPTPTRASTS